MKNHKSIYIFMALLCVWCPLFMAAWDKDKPSSSTSLRSSNPEMLSNQAALETAIGQDHEFSTGGTNSGEHTQIKFNVPISTPANAANKAWLYSKDVSAVTELHWEDESGNELQMSSGGDLFSSTNLVVTGTSTFNGSITLGAGDDLIGSATSDITFNTNKFTVAGATGNTVIAGTCDITGATEVTGVATLGDASLLKTSAAPTTDAMIANKKYVDDTPHTGGVIQVVNVQDGAVLSTAATIPFDDTIPQNSEGAEVMTLAITPTNANNKLKIEVIVNCSNNGAGQTPTIALFQDATANALATVSNRQSTATGLEVSSFIHFMTAGTTSETTFKIRMGGSAGATTFNGVSGTRRFGGVLASSITITELKV